MVVLEAAAATAVHGGAEAEAGGGGAAAAGQAAGDAGAKGGRGVCKGGNLGKNQLCREIEEPLALIRLLGRGLEFNRSFLNRRRAFSHPEENLR